MQSFLPDPPEDLIKKRVADALEKHRRRIQSMKHFVRTTKATDFANLQSLTERTQYVHDHKAMKRKGGSPPKDFTAIEMFVDLQRAVEADLLDEALPLYFQLKKMLGYFE